MDPQCRGIAGDNRAADQVERITPLKDKWADSQPTAVMRGELVMVGSRRPRCQIADTDVVMLATE
jgi:hypothetical protein